MYCLSGVARPWLRRVDHLICAVPDIHEAIALFLALGFPLAWPAGRFWPQGQTAGVALGGLNLEFLQPDQDAPSVAQIRTIAFEPISIEEAVQALSYRGISDFTYLAKEETDSTKLALRGLEPRPDGAPQMICHNAYPSGEMPIDFFLCEYSAALRERLAPAAFPGLAPITGIVLATPQPAGDWRRINELFGLPIRSRGADILLSEDPGQFREVIAIRSDRGPIDLQGWPARFRFT